MVNRQTGTRRANARHQDAIGPSAKPNETNSLARRERRDDRVSGWVEGRDLGSVPRLAPGLDVERDRSCCAGVNRAWCLSEHTLHCRTVKLPGPFGQRGLPERWAKERSLYGHHRQPCGEQIELTEQVVVSPHEFLAFLAQQIARGSNLPREVAIVNRYRLGPGIVGLGDVKAERPDPNPDAAHATAQLNCHTKISVGVFFLRRVS